MKNRALTTATTRGVAFAAITLLFTTISFFEGYLWAVYVGFFLTMAFGAKKVEYKNYVCSLTIGYLWSCFYILLPLFFENVFRFPTFLAMSVAELFLTFVLLFVHIRFTSNTVFNKIPFIFAAITSVFIGGKENIPVCGLSVLIGITMAVLSEISIAYILNAIERKENAKTQKKKNITVYLGANEGNSPDFRNAASELGNFIGESGYGLVYGGSKNGLMGILAESVLSSGGTVTGVEPKFFIEKGYQCDGLTELIVTKDMAERKAKMIELGDAFIAFPGGTGTLEEISEIMSKVSLKQLNAPCILYNLNGYYDDLKNMLNHMTETGLSSLERQEGIYFAENLEEIKALLG